MIKTQIQFFRNSRNLLILPLFISALFACGKEKRSEKKGEDMQKFIIDISSYARRFDSDFIVVPQNGLELAFDKLDAENNLRTDFINAIDGFGVEALFYYGDLSVDDYRLKMARKIVQGKTILSADYLAENVNLADALLRNNAEGFLSFPRKSTNFDYLEIPADIAQENSLDVIKLKDAKNYLYLISTSGFTSKQQMIDAIAATNYDALIIDAFFGDDLWTKSEIEVLKTKANGGKRIVLSYMSIGSAEKYRYYWKSNWKLHRPNWLKKEYDGYPDEIWVKYWKKEWQDIIFGNDDSYTNKVISAGFDGVYLDNVEAYYALYHKD